MAIVIKEIRVRASIGREDKSCIALDQMLDQMQRNILKQLKKEMRYNALNRKER